MCNWFKADVSIFHLKKSIIVHKTLTHSLTYLGFTEATIDSMLTHYYWFGPFQFILPTNHVKSKRLPPLQETRQLQRSRQGGDAVSTRAARAGADRAAHPAWSPDAVSPLLPHGLPVSPRHLPPWHHLWACATLHLWMTKHMAKIKTQTRFNWKLRLLEQSTFLHGFSFLTWLYGIYDYMTYMA